MIREQFFHEFLFLSFLRQFIGLKKVLFSGFESDDFDGSADIGITSLDGSVAAIAKVCTLYIVHYRNYNHAS